MPPITAETHLLANDIQLDSIVERAEMLGCWPDDTIVERHVDTTDLLVTVGRRKGRERSFRVDVSGHVSRP